MRLLTFVVVLSFTLLARSAVAADSFQAVDSFEKDGAYSLIVVPHSWNGDFIVYAHGFDIDHRNLKPYPSDLTPANITAKLAGTEPVALLPLSLGYAIGVTTYRSVGWAIGDAWRDVDNVRRHFGKQFGKPTHTYVWGHSEGGLVTQAVIEKERHAYDGALPLCAPGAGGRRNLNAGWDLRAAYEFICAGVAGSEFRCNVCSDGNTRCFGDADCPSGQSCGGLEPAYPPEWGLTPECTEFLWKKPGDASPAPRTVEFIARRADACFGIAAPTSQQAARRSLFLRASRIPESFLLTDLFFASAALGEVRNRRTEGGVPWSNDGVTYRSPLLTPAEEAAFNAGVPRATNDAQATQFLRRSYEPRGRTGSKVLTLHALDDGLVLPENEEKYRELFATVGRADQLVQAYTPTGGHCGFSRAEHLALLKSMFAWVEQGTKPSTASLQASCAAAAPQVGGPCRIQDAHPGEFGDRVVERRQRGLSLRTLVCDGDPEDCPVDAVCSPRLDRCVPR